QDLVDTHPPLLERQGSAHEVEAPHPRHLFAYEREDLVPPGLEVGAPLLGGAHVVLAERVDVAYLEAPDLQQPDGLTQRTHVHVGRDVRLDARTTPGRGARTAGHLLHEEA